MLKTTLLILCLLTLWACAEEPPAPTGPRYLGSPPEVWAKAMVVPDLRKQETELNRLALGREDVIPVLIVLLGHEDEQVVAGAYTALEANLGRVEDKKPWIPAVQAATKANDPDIQKSAKETLAGLTAE